MRKNYISPISETMMVHSIDIICSASATKTVEVKDGSFDSEVKFF